jgi:nucleotide-binding universal stress UspA family protein
MHRPGPVICAIDLDDLAPRLISAACTLARRTEVDVRVVHVVTPGAGAGPAESSRSRRLALPPRSRRARVAREDELARRIADAEAMMVRLGVGAEQRLVLRGNPVPEIGTIATRLHAAMLVIGTRGRGSVKAAVLGSVSRDLLRSAPCPVMVLPSAADEFLRGDAIVCGVDDDGRGDGAASVAASLVETIGNRLVLAHVTQRNDAAAARQTRAAAPAGELPASAALDPARLLRDTRQHVREGVDVTVALRQGVAAEQLAVLARDVDAAAIVVASRGAGPLSTMVSGSVAQELTTRSHCPVVVVPAVAG